MLGKIWSWLKGWPWVLLTVPVLGVVWVWRRIRGAQKGPEVTGPTLTPDQARDARERIQDARDRKIGEIETRWDDLRERWTRWDGRPK